MPFLLKIFSIFDELFTRNIQQVGARFQVKSFLIKLAGIWGCFTPNAPAIIDSCNERKEIQKSRSGTPNDCPIPIRRLGNPQMNCQVIENQIIAPCLSKVRQANDIRTVKEIAFDRHEICNLTQRVISDMMGNVLE